MDENPSHNSSCNIMDTNDEEEMMMKADSVPCRRDQSTPLPVPNAVAADDDESDAVVTFRRGRRGLRPCPINTDSSDLLFNEDSNNCSRSSFMSDDSGGGGGCGGGGSGDNRSRRTSVGAESGYVGSPLGNRTMSITMSSSFSPSFLWHPSMSFTYSNSSSTSSSPSYVISQPFSSRFFPNNYFGVPFNQPPPPPPNQPSQAGDGGINRREIERHSVRPPEFDVEQYRAPPSAHNFRSIGTQTSDVLPGHWRNAFYDDDGDNGYDELDDTGPDDVFNNDNASNELSAQLPGSLPDLVLELGSRPRRNSVTLPVSHPPSSPESVGRWLKTVAAADVELSRRLHGQQNSDSSGAGIISFLRSSFRSRPRQRSQSASEAIDARAINPATHYFQQQQQNHQRPFFFLYPREEEPDEPTESSASNSTSTATQTNNQERKFL